MNRRWVVLLVLALWAFAPARAWADVESGSADNVQEGDNDNASDQDGDAESGDVVAGQVVGVTSSGDASVDATNRSEDVDATSGDAEGDNASAAIVGLIVGGSPDALAADIANGGATNVQEGDNASEDVQRAFTSSGDALGGQVAGVVTAAGGVTDIVLANESIDVNVDSGDAEFDNESLKFVGLLAGENGGGAIFISVSDATSDEPGTLSFVVSITGTKGKAKADAAGGEQPPPTTSGYTFTASTSDGSANEEGQPGDYDGQSGTFTIPSGQNSTTVNVNVNDDGACEQDETMNLTLGGSSGVLIEDGEGVGTIFADEGDC